MLIAAFISCKRSPTLAADAVSTRALGKLLFGDREAQPQPNVARKRPSFPTKRFLFGNFRLTLAFLRGRGCAWIAALINRPTSGLIR